MDVAARIGRRDIAALQLYMLPRHRTNWIYAGVLFVIFLVINLTSDDPVSGAREIAGLLAVAFAAAIAALLLCILLLFFTVSRKHPILGVHHYSMSEAGLFVRSELNESLQKWAGIRTILKNANYIWLGIDGSLYYILPRRSFASSEDFNAFFERARALRSGAGSQG